MPARSGAASSWRDWAWSRSRASGTRSRPCAGSSRRRRRSLSRLLEAQLDQLRGELGSREALAPEVAAAWALEPLLSPQQARRYGDKSRFQAWPAGRRSGKTNLAEKLLAKVTRDTKGQQFFYVSTSIKRAVSTIWDELVLLNLDHKLGGEPNLTLHTMRFPGGGLLTVTGVEDKTMANDLRGRPKVGGWFIDECQDWKDDLLRYFYNEVVYYSLADVAGWVKMAGTGGPPDGFWYEVATSLPEWQRHEEWTPLDNPFLAPGEAAALIAKACKDRGVDVNDPSIQREFFAKFMVDLVRQIFPYDAAKNGYRRGTWDHRAGWWTGGDLPVGDWQVVVAADFGTVDAAAWAAIGWTKHDPRLWLLETDAQPCLGSSAQVTMVKAATEKYARFLVASVGDPGGGGKSHMTDLRQEHWIPVEVAEKAGKASACLLMRGNLRSGKLMVAIEEPEFISQMQKPEWDPNAVGQVIRGHFPDRVDAALYGHRRATGFHHYEPAPAAKSPYEMELERAFAAQEAEKERMREWGLTRY